MNNRGSMGKRKAWLLGKFNMAASNISFHFFGRDYAFSSLRKVRYFIIFYVYEGKVIL